ncbi:MAG TPA: hypothetical protein VGD60_18300 [Candidatus Acidoferrales bacterium]
MNPSLAQQEKHLAAMEARPRRSMRILLSVPVTVDGKVSDQGFCEDTRTLVVNAHGALISLAASVSTGQTIKIVNSATHDCRDCRIVYMGSAQAGRRQLGVEFLEPSSSFWQIDFPPDDWAGFPSILRR